MNVATAPAGRDVVNDIVLSRTANSRADVVVFSTMSAVDRSSEFLNATVSKPLGADEAIRTAPGRTNRLACARA